MAADGPQICLEVRQIKKFYGDQTVLREVSFNLPAGEILGLIGPNGAGKSTLFNIISGWQRPDSGSLVFFGQEISNWSPTRLSRAGLARTFQIPQIFPDMSARENVLMGAWLGREPRLALPQAQEEADYCLSLVGLQDKGQTLARELPLAQQRLVELARALATRPRLLLLDEVAAGFSLAAVQRLAEGLAKLRDQGLTLLLTDHLFNLLEEVADRVLALDRGEIIVQGPPAELIHHPEVVSAYLGTRCGADDNGGPDAG
jgi:branched-chain amino acid transport system ATP-binding protein